MIKSMLRTQSKLNAYFKYKIIKKKLNLISKDSIIASYHTRKHVILRIDTFINHLIDYTIRNIDL